MAIQERLKFLLCKLETGSYGVDSTPLGVDAILTKNFSIQPYLGNKVSRDLNLPHLGGQQNINTAPYITISFEVEIAGSGSNSPETAAPYDALLRICGLALTSSGGGRYDPVSTGFESATCKFIHGSGSDAQVHSMRGCRGSLEWVFEAGGLPMMRFTITGLYDQPAAIGSPVYSIDTTEFQAPLPVNDTNTTTATLFGETVIMRSCSVNLNNNVAFRPLVNSESVLITDRATSGSMVIEAPNIATYNWFSSVRSDNGVTLGLLNIVHGTVAGNIATLSTPSSTVQLDDISFSESDGITEYTIPFNLVPTDTGNDEIRFALS